MSGGVNAVKGFVYQWDYAVFRVLASEARQILISDQTEDCITSFTIEGRQTPEGPAWDVAWTLRNGDIHLRECKDAEITADDRKAFYRRVRKEIAAGTDPSRLWIGWVTDPGKQGRLLQYFEGMARVAQTSTEIQGNTLPERVESPNTSLQEAIYYLSNDPEGPECHVPQDAARLSLSRLTIDRYRAKDLAKSVELLGEAVLQSGTGTTIREIIQGKVATTIQERYSVEYSAKAFLDELKIAQLTLEMAGLFREVLRVARAVPEKPGIHWSHCLGGPRKVWSLVERLPEWDAGQSLVLIGKTGVGKTTATCQMFEYQSQRLPKHQVLRVEVGSVRRDVIESLPYVCCLLSGVSATWLAIDGLDQITFAEQQVWRQALTQLLAIPNLTIVIGARQEVVAAHDWMQELLASLPELPLDELTELQIALEFERVGLKPPTNRALIECLKNPFLFYLYARIVSDEDLPLAAQGEVTAFDIIEQYWKRRVKSESQGHRAFDGSSTNAPAKRAAIGYLADCTLAGDLVVRRPFENSLIANGIESLCREGVLHDWSTGTVNWSHDWLREYAITERIIERITNPNTEAIAKEVCSITIDHVARTVAVGGCKWIVSHSDLGDVETYLAALYSGNTGAAREALTVLLEDSPRHLRLGRLSTRLLIEAIGLARAMRARQWLDQVASLPDSLFVSQEGAVLNSAVLSYESELMNHE
jgi:hypothetical protein